MKEFSIFFITLLATTIGASNANAQSTGLLYITSYNDTADIGYICHGVPQNEISIGWAAVNLIPSVPIQIDSFISTGDTNAFQYLGSTGLDTFTLGQGVYYSSSIYYTPKRVGDDTLHITGYYNGNLTSTANLIFHARNSPDLAMYGYTVKSVELGGGNSIGSSQEMEEADTMHDHIASYHVYRIGDLPYEDGGVEDIIGDVPVVLRSCGGATIDSIYESGDFSEFQFDPFPTLPYTIQEDDPLVLNYLFTPQVVDEKGLRHHYLIFHSTDGHYLTWSFEYKVYQVAGVAGSGPNSESSLNVYPNPASSQLQIVGMSGSGAQDIARLYDLLGREVLNASLTMQSGNTSETTLDVSHLPEGTYFLRSGSQSAHVEILR